MMNAQEIYKAAIEHYGRETQMLVCIEEMAELIQAICKRMRGANNPDNLAEEMADVHITQEQLRMMFWSEWLLALDKWMPNKVNRLEKRITGRCRSEDLHNEIIDWYREFLPDAKKKSSKARVVVRRMER